MQRLRWDDDLAKEIIAGALGIEPGEPLSGAVIQTGNHVTGAVIFNTYEPGRNIWISVVHAGQISRAVPRQIADYVFNALGCHRCSAVTSERNVRAIRALKILGFKEEGRMRDYFGDADGLMFGLTRRDQRLVREG